MIRKKLFLPIMGTVLLTEITTLIAVKPSHLIINACLATLFLFLSGAYLYDFTYRRQFRTISGLWSYGFTSVVSILLSEAIAIKYASWLYTSHFPHHHVYSNAEALGSALVILTTYGYPQMAGRAQGIVTVLMMYSWIVNVLLLSKLISILQSKVR